MAPQLFSSICNESGLSIQEIANRAEVSPSTVRRAVQGERISPDTAYRLACVFRRKVADIIWRLGSNTKPPGATGKNKRLRPLPERDCNAHGRYPEHLGTCPECT
jgi:transcriptional regulator with XRE-family HTH domain